MIDARSAVRSGMYWFFLLQICAVDGGAQIPPNAIVDLVVPGGRVGQFRHGTKVHACYSESGLSRISLRTEPFSVRCTRTANLVHAGTDIVATSGSQVFPIANGTVIDVVAGNGDKDFGSLGYSVFVRHDTLGDTAPAYSAYFHLRAPPLVGRGAKVVAGETRLGYVGATGSATGPHLHIEVRRFASRFSDRWANIYGKEDPTASGGTFDSQHFESEWKDPETIATRHAPPEPTPSLLAADSAEVWLRRGVAYATGAGSPVNGGLAVQWLERAAGTSTVHAGPAAGWLGAVYLNGMGTKKDGPLALKWFERAAELGSGAGAQNLGEMYHNGTLVRRDRQKGATWFRTAAELYEAELPGGDAVVAYRLGRLYYLGLGVTTDIGKAQMLFEQAAAAGSAQAAEALATVKAETTRAAQAPAQAVTRSRFPTAIDQVSGGEFALAHACPSGVEQFRFESMGIAYKVVTTLPASDVFLDPTAFRGLIDRSLAFVRQACRGLNVSRADLVYLSPEFSDSSTPAATVKYRGDVMTAIGTGRPVTLQIKNTVLVRSNYSKFLKDFAPRQIVSFAALTGNPFAFSDHTVGVLVEFRGMETASFGLFQPATGDDQLERAIRGIAPEVIGIEGIPARAFVRRGQWALVAATVRGRTDREFGGSRIPLLTYVGHFLCSDSACSDILP